jgi:hypothetical protein
VLILRVETALANWTLPMDSVSSIGDRNARRRSRHICGRKHKLATCLQHKLAAADKITIHGP